MVRIYVLASHSCASVVISSFNAIFVLYKAADQARVMQEQMSGGGVAMSPDPKQAFKAEWEALEICEHKWALESIEAEVTGTETSPDNLYLQNKVD